MNVSHEEQEHWPKISNGFLPTRLSCQGAPQGSTPSGLRGTKRRTLGHDEPSLTGRGVATRLGASLLQPSSHWHYVTGDPPSSPHVQAQPSAVPFTLGVRSRKCLSPCPQASHVLPTCTLFLVQPHYLCKPQSEFLSGSPPPGSPS